MPTATSTADGGLVETTITSDPPSGAQTLHIQKVDAAGQPVGVELDATQYSPCLPVQVTALADGGYAVGCGYEFRGGNYQVSVFGADGAPSTPSR
ncbi:MAG: hypothetical protein KGO51_16015 [Alphaproteobacteria bacterium]|nr:hypothetical protein [Alphaproteobacteria bacterium]